MVHSYKISKLIYLIIHCFIIFQDEVITVIRRVDEHWAEGRLEERIGIFPISFVDFNDSAKWLLNNPPLAAQQSNGHSSSSSSHAHSSNQSSSSHNANSLTNVSPPSSSLGNRPVAMAGGLHSNHVATAAGPLSNHGVATAAGPPSNAVATTLGILITTAPSPVSSPSALMAFAAASLNPNTVAMQTGHHHRHKRHSLTTLGNNQKISLPPSQHRHSMELPLNVAVTAMASNVTTVTTPVRSDAPAGVITSSTPVVMTTAVGEASSSVPSRLKSSLPAM